jgi:hypothetical protein
MRGISKPLLSFIAGIAGAVLAAAQLFFVPNPKKSAPAANPAPVRKNPRRLIPFFSIVLSVLSLLLKFPKITFCIYLLNSGATDAGGIACL